MKTTGKYIVIALFLLVMKGATSPVYAACNWSMVNGAITATTCGIDAQSTEAYDYSSGTDDATNGNVLTIPNGVTVTLNAGAVGVPTTLNFGSLVVTGTGSLVVSANYVQTQTGYKCYVTDADADGYSPTPNTCYTTAAAGRIRKYSSGYRTGTDCGDAAASANPGQSAAQSTTFTNTLTGLSGDWNCNGTETKTYATANYSCGGCTNGSGYASFQNTTNGYLTTVPACGVGGTYYTVTDATCNDPAVANCAAEATTSTVTQTCL